jgi:hypothetical protein
MRVKRRKSGARFNGLTSGSREENRAPIRTPPADVESEKSPFLLREFFKKSKDWH